MTDRELLELAAKAAGIRWPQPCLSSIAMQYEQMKSWNPLTNDGDALRLAVKLEMNVDIGHHFTEASMIRDDTRIGADERHDDDPFYATRRAIVRAAAEIGKAMP